MSIRRLRALFTIDTLFLLFLAVLTLGYLRESYMITPLAGALPKVICWIMLALLAFLLYGKVRDWMASGPAADGKPPETEASADARRPHTLPWFVTCLIIFMFPVMIMVVGFPAATLIFTGVLSILLGLKPLHGVLFAVGCTVALMLLFVVALQVPLPDGMVLESIRGY